MTFNSYCKANILEPLEMLNSSWYNNEVNPNKQVIQYARLSKDTVINKLISNLVEKPVGDYLQLCNYSFYNYPDGLFKTSVNDISRFLETIMNKGRYKNFQLLKETTVSKMLTLQLKGNAIQGLGWKKNKGEKFDLWGHSGRDPGVRAHMYFNPETNIGIVLFQNNDEGASIKLVNEMHTIMTKK